MRNSRFTKVIAGAALTASTLGMAAMIAAGTANAGTAADEQFLSALQQQGIEVGSPQSAVKVAHNVCNALGEGTQPREISQQLVSANPGMSQESSLNFIVDAVQSYCPQYQHRKANGEVVISAA